MWVKDVRGGLVNINHLAGVVYFGGRVIGFYEDPSDDNLVTLFAGCEKDCKKYIEALAKFVGVVEIEIEIEPEIGS